MGSVDSPTEMEVSWYIMGMGKKVAGVNPWWVSAGIQQTPTLQSFSPSDSALLSVQLQGICGTCGKAGKGNVLVKVSRCFSCFVVSWSVTVVLSCSQLFRN